jgi:hypothetical protein
MALIPSKPKLLDNLQYSQLDKKWGSYGWWIREGDHKVLILQADQRKIIKSLHDSCHLGQDALILLVSEKPQERVCGCRPLHNVRNTLTCLLCLQNNLGGNLRPPSLAQL